MILKSQSKEINFYRKHETNELYESNHKNLINLQEEYGTKEDKNPIIKYDNHQININQLVQMNPIQRPKPKKQNQTELKKVIQVKIGGKTAIKFAKEGYFAVIARRNKEALKEVEESIVSNGGKCLSISLDATKEEDVVKAVEKIEKEVGPIEVGLYNAGAFMMKQLNDTTGKEFQNQWQVNAFGGFIFGREVTKYMLKRGKGSLFFTGATASLRAKGNFAALGSSKMALRGIAQGFAKELGSKGIHVSHVVVDGMVTGPRVLSFMGQEKFDKMKYRMIESDQIAETYWYLHNQKSSCWTFEMDIRNKNCDW